MDLQEKTGLRTARTGRETHRISTVLVLAASCVLFTSHFLSTSFTCDDAYISFRYAKNSAQGYGLVYNPGERVEGYSNPLWVFVLTAGDVLGIGPEALAQILGLVGGLGALVGAYFLATALGGGTWWVFLVPACLALSRDLVAWSSSGLEMGLYSFLVVAGLTCAVRESKGDHKPHSIWLAVLVALTRPDGLLWAFAFAWIGGKSRRERIARLGFMGVLLFPFLVFRLSYYGRFLPNTFATKGGLNVPRGLFYLSEYLRTHPGVPMWAPLVVVAKRSTSRATLGAALLVYLTYVVAVGGDFMEFRLLVPVMVLSVSLVPGILARLRPPLAGLLAVGCLAGSWFTSFTGYRQTPSPYMVESIESIRRSAENWAAIGTFLGSTMRPDELIAVGPAGAVPYFSNLPAIDMLGLCDSWVAAHGSRASSAAGHEKIATPEYLRQRGVVWIVGQPHVARVPDRSPEKISVKLPGNAYLILGTTLDSDSLRNELEVRGREVAWPDTAAQAVAGRQAARSLIRGWHLLAEGRTGEAQREAREVLRVARTLGVTWQWLLREGGLLEAACLKGDLESRGERKRWDQVEGSVPHRWRAALEAAQAAARSARAKGVDRAPRQD